MHVIETDQFLFYTAGKVGTRTLLSIPGSVDITKNSEMRLDHNLNAFAMSKLTQRKIITDKKIVCVVREPESRMYSGLYEIIAKANCSPFLQQMLNQRCDFSFLRSPVFWESVIENAFNSFPKEWDIFPSYFWNYHVGNWLINAELITKSYDSILIDLTKLSEFLDSKNLSYTHENKYSNFVSPTLGNPQIIFEMFKSGLDKFLPQIQTYLIEEKDIYYRLKNSEDYNGF